MSHDTWTIAAGDQIVINQSKHAGHRLAPCLREIAPVANCGTYVPFSRAPWDFLTAGFQAPGLAEYDGSRMQSGKRGGQKTLNRRVPSWVRIEQRGDPLRL
jgi:hypothetical protein